DGGGGEVPAVVGRGARGPRRAVDRAPPPRPRRGAVLVGARCGRGVRSRVDLGAPRRAARSRSFYGGIRMTRISLLTLLFLTSGCGSSSPVAVTDAGTTPRDGGTTAQDGG